MTFRVSQLYFGNFKVGRGRLLFCVFTLSNLFVVLAGAQPTVDTDRVKISESLCELGLDGWASTPVYSVYFHVPVETANQVPLRFQITSDQLIDYRLIRTSNHNVLAVARLRSAHSTVLTCRSWTLVDDIDYDDLPEVTMMSTLADLPDSVLTYLQSTATAQVESSTVQQWVSNYSHLPWLNIVADLIFQRCESIEPDYNHSPVSYDAHYALNWGSSCTGHAHAITALMRGMGIPCRTKISLISWMQSPYDCHWTNDYFIPEYGWVGLDADTNFNPLWPQREIVLYECEPSDEFPLFYKHGIDGFWHTSDPALGMTNPNWRLSHSNPSVNNIYCSTEQRGALMAAVRRAFNHDVDTRGTTMPLADLSHLAAARSLQELAFQNLEQDDVDGAITHLLQATDQYEAIASSDLVTRFETDFESGPMNWTHGGTNDSWEWGTPAVEGLNAGYSGTRVWGTGLNRYYDPLSDAWLETPPINLSGMRSAQLEFRTWIQTCGWTLYGGGDYLWLDITTDGEQYTPLCSPMIGGIEDPAIPVVKGWARMDLDLTPYVGETVQIRFRFNSNSNANREGVYLDDVKITGRVAAASGIPEELPDTPKVLSGVQVFPNPFNPKTQIDFEMNRPQRVKVAIYDLNGRRVTVLADRVFESGTSSIDWRGQDAAGRPVPSGSYLLRIESGTDIQAKKLVLVR